MTELEACPARAGHFAVMVRKQKHGDEACVYFLFPFLSWRGNFCALSLFSPPSPFPLPFYNPLNKLYSLWKKRSLSLAWAIWDLVLKTNIRDWRVDSWVGNTSALTGALSLVHSTIQRLTIIHNSSAKKWTLPSDLHDTKHTFCAHRYKQAKHQTYKIV